jgi:hypothetical protein
MKLSDQISTFPDTFDNPERDAVIDANRRADEATAKLERMQDQLDMTVRERAEAEKRYIHCVGVNIDTDKALKAALDLIVHLAGRND